MPRLKPRKIYAEGGGASIYLPPRKIKFDGKIYHMKGYMGYHFKEDAIKTARNIRELGKKARIFRFRRSYYIYER